MRRDLFGALSGLIFIVLVVIGAIIAGEPPDVKSPVGEIVEHYVDNKDAIIVSSFIGAVGVILFVFFANHLRRVFSLAGDAPFAPLVLVGASIMAVGFAIDATILLALAESVEDIDEAAVQALQALWDNDFIPIALGTLIFLLSAGISTLQTGALPRWLGWVALVLVLVGLTPLGFVAFLGGAIWVLVASVMLAVRSRNEPPLGRTAPAQGDSLQR